MHDIKIQEDIIAEVSFFVIPSIWSDAEVQEV